MNTKNIIIIYTLAIITGTIAFIAMCNDNAKVTAFFSVLYGVVLGIYSTKVGKAN